MFKKVIYLMLKKDIIKKLKNKGYGIQFIDNVTEALEIPSNLTDEYYRNLDMSSVKQILEDNNAN